MTVGELLEMLQSLPAEREVRVKLDNEHECALQVFDLGFDPVIGCEVIYAEGEGK